MSLLATPVFSVEQVLDLPHDHQYDLLAPAQYTDPTINAIYEALAALGIAPADLALPPFDEECSSMTRMDAELVHVDVDTEADPITSMVLSGCVNPALLMLPEAARPLLPPLPSAVLPDQDMSISVSQPFECEFELREATPAGTVWDAEEEEDDVESDVEQEETEGEDDAQDSDFEERPKRRVTRPLPRRVAGKAATVPTQSRPTPTTSKVKPRGSRASPSVSESKSTSASSSSATAPKRGTKRKATRPAARRAPKKAAVARNPPSSTASLDLPPISGVTDAGLPPPPNSAGICPTYWPLLRLGCAPAATGGIACGVSGCKLTAGSWGDMGRHVPAVHFRRQAAALACEACPRTFARKDAIKRHVLTRKAAHFSDERKAFLGEFNRIPAVVRMRAECPGDGESYVKLNDELDKMFDALFQQFAN